MTVTDRTAQAGAGPSPNPNSGGEDRFRRVVEGVIGVPATEGNRIDVLRNGDEIFPAMLEALENAQSTIDFLTFVYWEGTIGREFARRLAERARNGVRVRVLLDAFGAKPIEHSLVTEMQEAGVLVRWFRPLRRFHPNEVNHRTHRKVLVVDEAVGFVGGVGIADVWLGDARNPSEWRDTHFRLRGPVVDGLRAAFLDNWSETDSTLFDEAIDRFPDQPKPGSALAQCVRGASEVGHSDVFTLFRTLCQIARERLRITTAYFVPDAEIVERMCAAVQRGVVVEMLVPGPHADKRFVQLAGEAAYEKLLDGGVKIWTYQPSMLHAKILTVDGVLAEIGSANLNARSTNLDEEINVVAIDRDLVATLDRHFDEDLEKSVLLEPGRWRHRSPLQRVGEAVVAPIKRLF
ncbi:MAG TPA: phospholipase D-like domain-containing protein [Acidimicrobiia bacterium]|nr:phospholipase D-like domain-containing protein [Acidimicrobiia bacterium]